MIEEKIVVANLKITDESIRDSFPELWKVLEDDEVTDFDFNCGNIWFSTVSALPKQIVDSKLDAAYMERFAHYIGRMEGSNFNECEHTVYSGTNTLRITCIQESRTRSGLAVCIRKFGEKARLNRDNAVDIGFCDEGELHMLENVVDARLSCFVGGLPGVGKTETVKLMSSFIPKYEKTVIIEDVPEINYPINNPGANCTELRVMNGDYKECLETLLRLNTRWSIFGEVRGKEAKYLLESWSHGIPLMATGHVSGAAYVPDRILNMLNDRRDSVRIVNQLHKDIGLSLYINKHVEKDGTVRRYLQEACFFDRNGEENIKAMVVENGKLHKDKIPTYLRTRIEEKIGKDLFKQ